ncbi:glutaminyl-tRNA synthase (glutamine-hydrolyzing) subunit A [Candidatus Woesebacteria bacterium RBG_19FT_COMBO_47_8]|uniref:Glutamyl-tRNA(Gln) amidotransferase subunit A n=1 Tax=Candidatus Woesebacteria bacterium RBG_13_46_13 TaxID=1802479 RepID=A0A1F7X3N0_9BACT|nr:MAG: glutaminyl-tRNA synthase (glutamine-hydrolyzing) subunit A [Candidatus Woesebacteria bacterium RBG_13_46_13]OGM17854.1 MAG: glutaminyl-tRNA synthase (glutamine-hydrolyzing) subunit A [Candidatus Woesebacteria bacterium RBG_19FT_COMBO_47_8]HJX59215.1 Asp-tRNA(Asn)/Glu-tRNA(Gln) amidotransferase subunit GatA [Patescibacteria group bacterium]
MKNLPFTIAEIQKLLLSKEVSCVELVDTYMENIEKANPKLNVFITVSKDKAYSDAKKVDKLIKDLGVDIKGEHPLFGTVVAHKDLFLTEGIRTTAGSKVLDTYIPAYSATVVARLESAGCITIGKTNCDAWAHGASGENSDYGPTKNPWNTEFVPGGSSSGSAVSVASGLTTIATGTDTGGSIRQPANFSGVVGFKPTYGAVSRYGVTAMASSLDSVGHFSQSVADAEKVFDVVRGEDGKDSTVKNFKAAKPKAKIKLGIPKEYFAEGVEEEVKDSVYKASKLFEKEGIELVEINLPHTRYAISVYYIIQPAEVSSNLGRYDGVRYGGPRTSFGAEAKRRIMLGTYVLSAGYYEAYYLKAMKVRSKIIEDFDKAFALVDAIIAPVSPTTAFRLGEKADDPLKMYLADILTVPANIAGIPGLAIPSGFSKAGLPLGIQLMGPRFSEHTLFALGELYQNASGWKFKLAKDL